jgi:hypothetical protein
MAKENKDTSNINNIKQNIINNVMNNRTFVVFEAFCNSPPDNNEIENGICWFPIRNTNNVIYAITNENFQNIDAVFWLHNVDQDSIKFYKGSIDLS